jgi:hypothetical protein
MFLDLLDLHIPILHVPLDSWLGMIRNKRQRTDEFRECTTNAVRGQTVKYVIDKAHRIVLRNHVDSCAHSAQIASGPKLVPA